MYDKKQMYEKKQAYKCMTKTCIQTYKCMIKNRHANV